jgi:hypothetical protein
VSPRLALIIGAVAAFVFGLLLVVFPAAMLSGFGLGTPNEGVVVSRDVGATLIGVGVINWLARDATGTPLRALLVGNVVIQALEIVVNGYEILAGTLPVSAAGGLVLHLVLGALFVLAMRQAR